MCLISCAQVWIRGGDYTSARFFFQQLSRRMLRNSDLDSSDLKTGVLCSELMPLREDAKESEHTQFLAGLGDSLSDLSLSAVKKARFLL